MGKQITWDESTNFTGRNGFMKCNGLNLQALSNDTELMVSPLTSKGAVGRCDISIPIEKLPEIISLLDGIYQANNTVVKSQETAISDDFCTLHQGSFSECSCND